MFFNENCKLYIFILVTLFNIFIQSEKFCFIFTCLAPELLEHLAQLLTNTLALILLRSINSQVLNQLFYLFIKLKICPKIN